HFLTQHPGHDIGGAPCREPDDEADGLFRIGRRGGRRRKQGYCSGKPCHQMPQAACCARCTHVVPPCMKLLAAVTSAPGSLLGARGSVNSAVCCNCGGTNRAGTK